MSEPTFHNPRQVAESYVGEIRISTVLLDYPVSAWLYETMIFGGEYDSWAWRYASLADAYEGHLEMVELIKAGKSPEDE